MSSGQPCDHNVIPVRVRFRARWICVRCDRVFDTPPPRADAVREEGE